jgi:putative NADH-flavin reductase
VKAILLGATGMVGQGVLRECLLDPEVESVLTIGRNATIHKHEKLHEIVVNDLSDLTSTEGSLSGYDACFFFLGVSAAGMKEDAYRRLTYDLTISVREYYPGSTPA